MKCKTCGSLMEHRNYPLPEGVIGLTDHHYNCKTCGRSETHYGISINVNCEGLHPQKRVTLEGFEDIRCSYCGELSKDCKCNGFLKSIDAYRKKRLEKK